MSLYFYLHKNCFALIFWTIPVNAQKKSHFCTGTALDTKLLESGSCLHVSARVLLVCHLNRKVVLRDCSVLGFFSLPFCVCVWVRVNHGAL